MSNFEIAVATVLRHEGGYIWNKNDPGGETNFGISKRTYPAMDIKNLSVLQAMAIYKADWWDRYGYGNILAQAIATKIFDTSVNLGPSRAHKFAQVIIGTYADGVLGPKTLAEINAFPSLKFIISYQEAMASFYRAIVVVNPAEQVFLNGWLSRAYDRS